MPRANVQRHLLPPSREVMDDDADLDTLSPELQAFKCLFPDSIDEACDQLRREHLNRDEAFDYMYVVEDVIYEAKDQHTAETSAWDRFIESGLTTLLITMLTDGALGGYTLAELAVNHNYEYTVWHLPVDNA